MSKLDENGQVVQRADGKVLKSAQWSPPELARLLVEGYDNEPAGFTD
jgi:hypothetical protein